MVPPSSFVANRLKATCLAEMCHAHETASYLAMTDRLSLRRDVVFRLRDDAGVSK